MRLNQQENIIYLNMTEKQSESMGGKKDPATGGPHEHHSEIIHSLVVSHGFDVVIQVDSLQLKRF